MGGWLRRVLRRNVDRFLAPSQFVRDKLRGSDLGIEPVVLPNFIQPKPRSTPTCGREPYYLYVGRLEKAKGLQTVLPLFNKPGRRLLIAGSGNYELDLRAQAANLPHIEFLGRVPYADLGTLYAGAKATLVPSLCYETFGLTVLESLQQATPVITSRLGALPEIVADTGGGETYGQLTELAAILDRFDRDAVHRRQLGECGHARLDRYSVSAHLDRYLGIIEEVRLDQTRVPALPGRSSQTAG
jgi:glycosyltransferase involved in cell wall biosynthesis